MSSILLTRHGLNLVERSGRLPKFILFLCYCTSTELAAGWGDLHAIIAVLTVLSTPSTSHSKIADLTPKILSSLSTVIFRLRGLCACRHIGAGGGGALHINHNKCICCTWPISAMCTVDKIFFIPMTSL